MYNQHFGLQDKPFTIAPNPRYLYLSQGHREALAHLLYGIDNPGGFTVLTGEVGTGKTTLCRCLIERLPDSTDLAYIINPKVTSLELLATICDELKIPYDAKRISIKTLIDLLNHYLLEAHINKRQTLLIIDEAQNLSRDVLEQLRLLTNLETNEQKLLQVVLFGQPELDQMLKREDLRQLAQRVTAHFHLQPLSKSEVGEYIGHRLKSASGHPDLIPQRLQKRIFRSSKGVPRMINRVCDRALLGAYAQNMYKVNNKILNQAIQEINGRKSGYRFRLFMLVALLLVLTTASSYYFRDVLQAQFFNEASVSHLPGSALGQTVEVDRITDAELFTQSSRNNQALFDTLLSQWELPINQSSQPPCAYANQFGLRCLQQSGGWNALIGLNRPAILDMYNDKGDPIKLITTQVDNNKLLLSNGTQQTWVTRQSVIQHWSGEFSILWKLPPGYKRALIPGGGGATIHWVRQQLQSDEEQALAADPKHYDPFLADSIQRFQQQQGLTADGVIGPRTLIKLNSYSTDIPRLFQESP